MPCRIAAIAMTMLLLQAGAAAQEKVDRAALIITNFAYPSALLDHVRQDSDAVAKQLFQSGFRVVEARNMQKRTGFRILTEFINSLRSNSISIFYFAGHAIQYKGRNHLLPIDAKLLRDTDVPAEGIELDIVVERLADAPGAGKLVIIDANRLSPYVVRLRTPPTGLAPIKPRVDMLIAYAAEPGRLELDDPSSGSIFASALVDALRRPGLTVDEIFQQVRDKVAADTQGNQAIWVASGLTQPLVLVPAKP